MCKLTVLGLGQLGGVAGMRGISAGLRDAMELLMDVAETAVVHAVTRGGNSNLLNIENPNPRGSGFSFYNLSIQ